MLSKGVDLLHDKVEVACYAHAVNGGVKIGADAMSDIGGLFAAGECAGGPHGADRLGGNMMVTCQVFGAIAGSKAAAYALRSVRGEADAESISRMKEMESFFTGKPIPKRCSSGSKKRRRTAFWSEGRKKGFAVSQKPSENFPASWKILRQRSPRTNVTSSYITD